MLFHIEAVKLPNGIFSALVDTTEVGLALSEREAVQLAYDYIYQNFKSIHSKPLKQKMIWQEDSDVAVNSAEDVVPEEDEEGDFHAVLESPVEAFECNPLQDENAIPKGFGFNTEY